MRPETEKWLQQTPVAALLCRDLRHAWPRPPEPNPRAARKRRPTDVPPSSDGIVWKVLATGSDISPRVLQRIMLCGAACGVQRTETFVVRSGRLVRTGKPVLKYPSWYRRTRTEPDEPLEPMDSEVLRGNIVARLYPGLNW